MGERHVLTEKAIERAKPALSGQRYVLWDAVTPSLGLRVTARGHKSFILQRRVNGRMLKLTLGEYPALALATAREQAQEALRHIVKGVNPRQAKPAPVRASGLRRDSFEAAVESYFTREVEKNRRLRTQDEIMRPLRRLSMRWGTLSLSEIDARDILEVLDELVDAGTPVAANRTYSVLRRFFRWAVERRLVRENPVVTIGKPAREQSRSRVLSDEEAREVCIACDDLGWPFGGFFRALLLTGQRRSEVAGMRWSEISADGATWTIPGARTKNARDHIVPLSAAMRQLLAATPSFVADIEDPLVFTTTGARPISGFSRAKRKLDALVLGKRQKVLNETNRETAKAKPMECTLHDFRRTCATGMGRLGIQPHIVEAVLNHTSGFRAGVAGIYQRQDYLEERRVALERWADHLSQLMSADQHPPNVIALRGRPL